MKNDQNRNKIIENRNKIHYFVIGIIFNLQL